MTDKENLLLARLKMNPNFMLAVQRLDLEPTTSEAEIFSKKVSNRISAWYAELQYSPVTQRSTVSDPSSSPRCFWTSKELARWIHDNNFTL